MHNIIFILCIYATVSNGFYVIFVTILYSGFHVGLIIINLSYIIDRSIIVFSTVYQMLKNDKTVWS